MRILQNAVLCSLLSSSYLIFGADAIDCAKKSLQDEVDKTKAGETINFSGTCGPVVIRTPNLTLIGVANARYYVLELRGTERS
jgi:hypothetical protein